MTLSTITADATVDKRYYHLWYLKGTDYSACARARAINWNLFPFCWLLLNCRITIKEIHLMFPTPIVSQMANQNKMYAWLLRMPTQNHPANNDNNNNNNPTTQQIRQHNSWIFMACQLDGEMHVKIFCSDFSIGYNSLHAHFYIYSKIFAGICTFEVIKNHFFVDLSRPNSILQFILDLQTGWLNLSLLRERKMKRKKTKRKYRVLCFEIKKKLSSIFRFGQWSHSASRPYLLILRTQNERTNERASEYATVYSFVPVCFVQTYTYALPQFGFCQIRKLDLFFITISAQPKLYISFIKNFIIRCLRMELGTLVAMLFAHIERNKAHNIVSIALLSQHHSGDAFSLIIRVCVINYMKNHSLSTMKANENSWFCFFCNIPCKRNDHTCIALLFRRAKWKKN